MNDRTLSLAGQPDFVSGLVRQVLACVSMGMTILALLLLGACSRASTPATDDGARLLTLDALPAGAGRGFPTVRIDGVANRGARIQPGDEPPNFRLEWEDGRYLNLHDLRGRPVLINFWATWCGPCRVEMPEIVAVTQTHPDWVVLAVNVQEGLEQIQRFAEEFQMEMPIVRDTDGDLRNLYGVRGMPTSLFIDRDGKIFTVWPGLLTAELLQKIITDVLYP